MQSQVLYTVWCDITDEAAVEVWTSSLSGVKGLKRCINEIVRIRSRIFFQQSYGQPSSSYYVLLYFFLRLQEKVDIDDSRDWKN